jgi:peptide/nickel transport system permease protein
VTGYLLRKLAGAVAVLLVMTALVYALFYLAPTDPALLACGKGCTADRLAMVRTSLGVDRPVAVQYGHFLEGLVAGRDYSSGPDVRHCPAPCLGYSFETDQPVLSVLLDRLPVSASLAFGAELLALLLGVGAGLLSALRRYPVVNKVLNAFILGGYATPVFLVGLVLLMVFCAYLQWLPFPSYVSPAVDPIAWAQNLILPWIALAVVMSAGYARLSRAGMLQALSEDHIRTARAYGLRERRVVVNHALRGALTPLITLTAIDVAGLITSAVLTETMFGLPGVGQLLVGAVNQVDLPVVVGVTLLAGFVVVLANTVADLAYAVADPRVELR